VLYCIRGLRRSGQLQPASLVEALRVDGVGAVGLNGVLRGVDDGPALRGERGASAAGRHGVLLVLEQRPLGRDVHEAHARVVGQDLPPRVLRDLKAVALVADGGDEVAGGIGVKIGNWAKQSARVIV